MSVACLRCGSFKVSATVKHGDIDLDLQRALGAATRQSIAPLVLVKDFAELARPHRESLISERPTKLLRHISNLCVRPGGSMLVHKDFDYTVADCATSEELVFYVQALQRKGLIESVWQQVANGWTCAPTLEGWTSIQPSQQTGGIPGTCFIALAMVPRMETAYREAIEPAARECGYEVRSMLDIRTNEGITDRILAEVRSAEFLIADFTEQRSGVYFEAGFAKGLGRPIVWSVHRDEIADVHFDTRHFGHVVWSSHEELKEQLIATIRANIIRSK